MPPTTRGTNRTQEKAQPAKHILDAGRIVGQAATQCANCRGEIVDAVTICTRCMDEIGGELRNAQNYLDELLVTATRQDAIADKHARVGGTRERPLGYRPDVSDAEHLLHATLIYWGRLVAEANGVPLYELPVAQAALMANWLTVHRETIRRHDGAARMLAELRMANTNARRLIDRPAERVYLGRCDCERELYAREGAGQVACRHCKTVHNVRQRRDLLRDIIRDHLATAADIAAGIGELHGTDINRKRINQWHSRNRLTSYGRSPDGYPLFRIGDVLDLATARPPRLHRPA